MCRVEMLEVVDTLLPCVGLLPLFAPPPFPPFLLLPLFRTALHSESR